MLNVNDCTVCFRINTNSKIYANYKCFTGIEDLLSQSLV